LKYNLPLEKILNEDVSVLVGVQGLISKFSGNTNSYNNNLAVLQVGGKFQLTENIRLNASLLPGWNNGEFALLPDIEATIKPATTNLVLQAGWKGYYTEQTWSRLAGFNPWIAQPDTLTHTRNNEFFAGVKAVVNEQFSFRIKAGLNIMNYVPLLVNDGYDGRYFKVLYEPEMTAVLASGEFTWQQGEKIRWYNALTLNAYSKTDVVEKAAGLLPFEFRSSLRLKLVKSLFLKADLYNFTGTWYTTNSGMVEKGKSATDLNAGLEFDITDKLKLWLNLNNILNQKYERWNQYQVLGFQAVGGIIFHL
jgi:hypothetical protein